MRAGATLSLAAMLMIGASASLQTAVAEGDTRSLTFHHLHTGENITITYKRDGRYDEAALKKLDWFMRDWRKEQTTSMDPHLFDLLWEVYREVGATAPIDVVCGYRSPTTNAMLRQRVRRASPSSASTRSATPWTSIFPACRWRNCARSACGCSVAASASIRPPARPSCTWTPAPSGTGRA